ncbi:glutamate receptor ionotropic, kainate glr-3-like [Scylla paramamosain]|uniref:glutamate receptor ionotropic, kainate glr-3-like n=1 Tax=Scylla paramamosain TaxID=85552 RepID=UPI003082EE49
MWHFWHEAHVMQVAQDSRCLRVAMAEFPAMTVISGSPPQYKFYGATVIVISLVADHLGFCIKFLRAPDGQYGEALPNGSWTGCIGMLQRDEADLGGTLFSVMWRRSAVVDFTFPLYIDQTNVFYTLPKVTSDMLGFIKPYTLQSWVMLIMGCVIVFLTITFVLQSAANMKRWSDPAALRESNSFQAGWQKTAEISWFWTWSTLLAQSMSWEPKKDSARMLAATWLLMSFILGAVYRSNLKAMLIIPKINLPFDNLDELYTSDITIAVVEGASMHLDVVNADKATGLGRLKENLLVYPADQQGKAIFNTINGMHAGFALEIGLAAVMHHDFSMTGICRLFMMSRGIQGPRSLSFILPKGSPLKSMVDPVLMALRESGILEKIIYDGVSNFSECANPAAILETHHRPLEITDFYGVFSLYTAVNVVQIFYADLLDTDAQI